jgi:hypothetical protein
MKIMFGSRKPTIVEVANMRIDFVFFFPAYSPDLQIYINRNGKRSHGCCLTALANPNDNPAISGLPI